MSDFLQHNQDDNNFFLRVVIIIGLVVVLLGGGLIAMSTYNHYLTDKEIAGGINPIVAACAHNTQGLGVQCGGVK